MGAARARAAPSLGWAPSRQLVRRLVRHVVRQTPQQLLQQRFRQLLRQPLRQQVWRPDVDEWPASGVPTTFGRPACALRLRSRGSGRADCGGGGRVQQSVLRSKVSVRLVSGLGINPRAVETQAGLILRAGGQPVFDPVRAQSGLSQAGLNPDHPGGEGRKRKKPNSESQMLKSQELSPGKVALVM